MALRLLRTTGLGFCFAPSPPPVPSEARPEPSRRVEGSRGRPDRGEARQEEAENGGLGSDWSLIRERAGLYAGAMVLVLLFGHQGWLLWQRGRMVFAWALSSPRPIWWDVDRVGERGGGRD